MATTEIPCILMQPRTMYNKPAGGMAILNVIIKTLFPVSLRVSE